MKKLIYPLLALLTLIACQKGKIYPDKKQTSAGAGTIILNQSPSANSGSTARLPPFTSQDSITVFGLMNSNNLSTNGFVFYTYQSYNALDQNNQMGYYQLATAKQVRNGLPVFFQDLTFPFENGKFNEPYPAPQFIVGNITLNNKPGRSLQALRDTFIKIDEAHEAYSISIKDSTLVAQLGYYNLNINNMPAGGAPNYIKVWYVHPQHWPWPLAYFRDDTGLAIFFQPLTHTGPVVP
jgi:hypothetical protein